MIYCDIHDMAKSISWNIAILEFAVIPVYHPSLMVSESRMHLNYFLSVMAKVVNTYVHGIFVRFLLLIDLQRFQ